MLMKYFNEKQEILTNAEIVENNIDDYIAIQDQIFNSIMKYV